MSDRTTVCADCGYPVRLVHRFPDGVEPDDYESHSALASQSESAVTEALRLPWTRETVGHANIEEIAAKNAADLAVPPAEGLPPNTDATWIVNADNKIVAFMGNGPRQTSNADTIIGAVAALASQPEPAVTEALRDVLGANGWYIARVDDATWVDSTEWGPILGADRALAAMPAPSPAPFAHMKQSVNGCVTCPRKWSEHTPAERGEPAPAAEPKGGEPSTDARQEAENLIAGSFRLRGWERGADERARSIVDDVIREARAASPSPAVAPPLDVERLVEAIHPHGKAPNVDCCMGSVERDLNDDPSEAERKHYAFHRRDAERLAAAYAEASEQEGEDA